MIAGGRERTAHRHDAIAGRQLLPVRRRLLPAREHEPLVRGHGVAAYLLRVPRRVRPDTMRLHVEHLRKHGAVWWTRFHSGAADPLFDEARAGEAWPACSRSLQLDDGHVAAEPEEFERLDRVPVGVAGAIFRGAIRRLRSKVMIIAWRIRRG